MSKRPAPSDTEEGRNVYPRVAGGPQYPGSGPTVQAQQPQPQTSSANQYLATSYPQQPAGQVSTASIGSNNSGIISSGGTQPSAVPPMNAVRGGPRQAGIIASGGAAPSAAALYSNAMSSIRGTQQSYNAPQFYYPVGAQGPDPYASHNPFLREQQIQYQQEKAAAAMRSHRQRVRADGKKVVLRRMGGKTWEDDTLADWPENDYRLFIGNLGNDVSEEPLRKAFSKYRSLAMVKVIRNKRTERTKGYGFVSFLDPQDYLKAYREMNGQYIMNRPCQIRKSDWNERNLKKKDIKKLKKGEINRKPKKPYKKPPNLPRFTPEAT